MNVTIIQPNLFGHRLAHVAMISHAVSDGACSLLTRDQTATSAEVEVHLGSSPIVIREVFTTNAPSTTQVVAAAGRETGLVVFPDADPLLRHVCRLVRRRTRAHWNLLVMRPPGPLVRYSPIAAVAKALAIAVLVCTPRTTVWLLHPLRRRPPPILGRRIRWIADPVTFAPASERITIGAGTAAGTATKWIGVFGVINERKHPDLVLAAVHRLGRSDVGLLLAGTVPERLEPLLADYRARGLSLVVENGVLSDERFDTLVASVDAVVCAQVEPYSSGVLLKAAVAGTPVVTCGSRVLRQTVRTLGAGVACDFRVEALAAALGEALSLGRTTARVDLIGGAAEFGSALARCTSVPSGEGAVAS